MSPTPPAGPDPERWRRTEAICDAALDLEGAARDAYLDLACGNDASLRRDVEALLARDAGAQGFLEVPVGALAADVMSNKERDLIGRRLGDYDVTALLGEGGMGEVYRARDRKLGRDVAIKVLPAAFADDAERLKRFEREARLLATVNHPGIGAIYGSIDVDGGRALVLELIEGETLGAALGRGPLPVARALTIAAQIADALDHAHRRGITHRDLKPSNVMLTPAGAKLLDFGVGKWTPPPGVDESTRHSTLTGEGAIVGTLHYMAPEQLAGKDADARSDLFALGAVLYEMLTGRKAFDGPSQASIIAAVMEAPVPPLSGIGGQHAPRLERIVNKGLAKAADERWQSARDLGDELRWLKDDASQHAYSGAAATRAPIGRTLGLALASVIAVAALGLISMDLWRRARPAAGAINAPVRFEVLPPRGSTFDYRGFDISEDGSQLAFVGTLQTTQRGEGQGIWVRRLDRLDAYLIPDTQGASMPRFSPDGQWLAYRFDGKVWKVRVAGDTPPQMLGEMPTQHGMRWMLDGTILIARRGLGLHRLGAGGGVAVEITSPTRDEVDHHAPVPLPDGRHILVPVHGPNNRFSIAAQAIGENSRKILVESGFAPAYSSTGHLVYGRGSTIFAAPFDLTRLETTGPPVAMIEHVDSVPGSGESEFQLSPAGTLAYIPQRPRTGRTLSWVGTDGKATPIPLPAGAIRMPRVSPDGAQLAYHVEHDDQQRQIWTYEFASGRRAQITRDGDHWSALWARDGQALIYARATTSGSEVVLHPLNAGDVTILGGNDNVISPTALTADGATVILNEAPPTEDFFVSQIPLARPAAPGRLPIDAARASGPRLSPDSRWIAFAAPEGDVLQVFVQAFPLAGTRRQISVDGGRTPVWSRDGRTLFFRTADRMFAVSIDTSRGLTWSAPRLLFETDSVYEFLDYDVMPDGRFVMINPDPQERDPPRFNIVVNWATELLSRVPVRR